MEYVPPQMINVVLTLMEKVKWRRNLKKGMTLKGQSTKEEEGLECTKLDEVQDANLNGFNFTLIYSCAGMKVEGINMNQETSHTEDIFSD